LKFERNIARNSKFNIKIDYARSRGSYIYDKTSAKEYLDFFGMYSSLPLGYNHKIFDTKRFKHEMLEVSKVKINNCEFTSDSSLEFDKQFMSFVAANLFTRAHYSCTGALAVEAAIKAACVYKKHKDIKVLSFHNSFHGINGLAGFFTSRLGSVQNRLEMLPDVFSFKTNFDIENIEKALKENEITCVLIEPIQCTAGDIYYERKLFKELESLCNKFNVPMIFDEIQTGFCVTGKVWYFQHLDIKPEMVVFGKKSQVSGVLFTPKLTKVLNKENTSKLEVTWDSDPVDMVRCKHIISHLLKKNSLKKIEDSGAFFLSELKKIKGVENPRGIGLLLAFDLKNEGLRDKVVKQMFDNGLISNKTGECSIRLRPHLLVKKEELKVGISIIRQSIGE